MMRAIFPVNPVFVILAGIHYITKFCVAMHSGALIPLSGTKCPRKEAVFYFDPETGSFPF